MQDRWKWVCMGAAAHPIFGSFINWILIVHNLKTFFGPAMNIVFKLYSIIQLIQEPNIGCAATPMHTHFQRSCMENVSISIIQKYVVCFNICGGDVKM